MISRRIALKAFNLVTDAFELEVKEHWVVPGVTQVIWLEHKASKHDIKFAPVEYASMNPRHIFWAGLELAAAPYESTEDIIAEVGKKILNSDVIMAEFDDNEFIRLLPLPMVSSYEELCLKLEVMR